jgi:hypothetical protein
VCVCVPVSPEPNGPRQGASFEPGHDIEAFHMQVFFGRATKTAPGCACRHVSSLLLN